MRRPSPWHLLHLALGMGLFLGISPHCLRAEEAPVIVRLDPLRVYLGDPATLEVEFAPPALSQEVWDTFGQALESIPGLEPEPRVSAKEGEPQRFRASYRSFELGPKEPLRLSLPLGPDGKNLEFFLPLPEVLPPRPRVEDKEGTYRRAKALVVPPPPRRDPRWAALLGAFFALGLFAWRSRKSPSKSHGPPPPPPLEAARRRLQELRARFPEEDPRISHYQLYEVVRGYTSSQFQVELPGETTRELLEHLSQVDLQEDSRKSLEKLLFALDRVKFGPEDSSVGTALENADRVEDVLELLDLEARRALKSSSPPAQNPTPTESGSPS